ncbi:MAG: hypothetical protein KAY37_12635 [Phycisphaerae bacterium]|nr:hypothetical protein [Phycisphaerae bacterium]
MSETEAVKEARRWRREVYDQRRSLKPPERRAREEELLRAAREAGVEFEEVIDADVAPSRTSARPRAGNK